MPSPNGQLRRLHMSGPPPTPEMYDRSGEDGEEEAAAAAIVVGWAMARQGVKFADAPALVAKARPSATLNSNFEKQLKVWETWKEFPGVPEWM